MDRDQAAAEAVLDEDFALVLVHPSPAIMPRERWLEVLPEYVIYEWTVEQQVLHDDGEGCAALLQRVNMQATVLGEDRSGIFFISDAWRRREGGWRIWRRHSSPLTAKAIPGARG